MLIIKLENNQLTPESINILNAAVVTALPDGFPIDSNDIDWSLDTTIDKHIPVVTGKHVIHGTYDNVTVIKPHYVIHIPDGTIQLTGIHIDSTSLDSPINFKVTPLNEVYILGKLESKEPEKRQAQSQLSACSKLVQEIYQDDPAYDIDITKIPKVFFSMMDFDYYFSNLAVTLEESILLWMESTYRLSVNMNDEGINVPLLLDKNIKRTFMSGPARNKVKIELHDGTQKNFSELSPAIQVELAREILSILPEI